MLDHYEGLVLKTSSMYVDFVNQMDFDDICQILRVKVWKALEAWDPNEPRTRKRIAAGKKSEADLRDGFVFGCVKNQVKDLLKRPKPADIFIEDLGTQQPSGENTLDRFDGKHLATDPELMFGDAEDSPPLIPNTLSHNERLVLAGAYVGMNGPEIAERIGVDKSKIAAIMRSLREKMDDWRPSAEPSAAEVTPSGARVRV